MAQSLQPDPILQSRLTDPPWALRGGTRLPGTGPTEADDWIRADDAYAAQMALRDRLIGERQTDVHTLRPAAMQAAGELLGMALEIVKTRPGFAVAPDQVRRPDGICVPLDRNQPLLTLGRLVQEDFCLMQAQSGEHVMTGAILCFPASWTLAEKIDRPLTGIHEPVDEYSPDIARRVQRLFDAIRPGRPIVRANCLLYNDPALFQPRREDARREKPQSYAAYVRSERQCLLRLPQTGAVAFSIHTTVVALAGLDPEERAAMQDFFARDGQS